MSQTFTDGKIYLQSYPALTPAEFEWNKTMRMKYLLRAMGEHSSKNARTLYLMLEKTFNETYCEAKIDTETK